MKRPPSDRIDVAYLPMGPLPPTGLTAQTVGLLRASLDERRAVAVASIDPSPVEVEDRTILGVAGERIRLRTYRGAAADALPVLVFLHGGGYVLGNLDTDHGRCIALALQAQCLVVSVEYRLAPEHPYPAGLDDAVAVVNQVLDHPDEFGADPDRLAVGGNSAGAGMAAAVALRLRDERGPGRLRFQLMHQPMLDIGCATSSMLEFDATPYWDSLSARAAWSMYRGDSAAAGYLSPSGATDLAGLPPAYICCSEVDPLRDDAISYAQRLLEAGVPTELHLLPGTCHGFDSIAPQAPQAVAELAQQAEALRRHLALTTEAFELRAR